MPCSGIRRCESEGAEVTSAAAHEVPLARHGGVREEHHDENSGQFYYYNPVTGETKWQHEMVGLGLIHSELTTRDTEVVVEYGSQRKAPR